MRREQPRSWSVSDGFSLKQLHEEAENILSSPYNIYEALLKITTLPNSIWMIELRMLMQLHKAYPNIRFFFRQEPAYWIVALFPVGELEDFVEYPTCFRISFVDEFFRMLLDEYDTPECLRATLLSIRLNMKEPIDHEAF